MNPPVTVRWRAQKEGTFHAFIGRGTPGRAACDERGWPERNDWPANGREKCQPCLAEVDRLNGEALMGPAQTMRPVATAPAQPAPVTAAPKAVVVSSPRLQPEGARLDERGQRLWQWFGQGHIEEFYSVTTMLGGSIKKDLIPWAVKLTAELAYRDVERHGRDALEHWAAEGRKYLDDLRDSGMKLEKADESPKGLALRYLKGEHERTRQGAADKGSQVHEEAETFVLRHARSGARFYAATGDLPTWPADIAPAMTGFLNFLVDYRPIYLFTEARVYSRSRSYAGQADAFLRVKVPDDWETPEWISRPFHDPDWLTLCVDYKSGKAFYHEVALQTAAYARGDFIGMRDNVTELPLPAVDGTAVLHLAPKAGPRGYRFELLRYDEQVFRTFLYAREIFAWLNRESRVGTRTWMGGPIPVDVMDAIEASLDARRAS